MTNHTVLMPYTDMGDIPMAESPLHVVTPLIESSVLSALTGCNVLLKLENCQPTGSFKIRGIGYLCNESKRIGKKKIVCSSGGNAGLAAAFAGRKLSMPTKIFVPTSTPTFTIERLRAEGAEVEVVGRIWDEANEAALTYMKECPESAFIHPYDHPSIWEGHSSLVEEIYQTLGSAHKPDCIVSCVGGGGLVAGIIRGLDRVGWSDVPVVAMETKGADSLAACVAAGRMVTIPSITSIAKSLGSRSICQQLYEYTLDHSVISHVVSDKEAVSACLRFADDHRMLVEPACGASLSAVYSGILQQLKASGRLGALTTVIMVVCGGNSVTIETLQQWRTSFDL